MTDHSQSPHLSPSDAWRNAAIDAAGRGIRPLGERISDAADAAVRVVLEHLLTESGTYTATLKSGQQIVVSDASVTVAIIEGLLADLERTDR